VANLSCMAERHRHLPQEAAGRRECLDQQIGGLGRLSRGEKVTLAVFAVTVFLWVTRPWLAAIGVGGVAPLIGMRLGG